MTENSSDRILVAVDGSQPSIKALRQAAELATALGCTLEALITWEYPAMVGYYPPTDWSPEDDAKKVLEATVTEAFGTTPPVGMRMSVANGPAPRVLIEQSEHARMLVMGSRGHGGFVGMVMGSVSLACAAHAKCPVLIVHADPEK